MASQISYGQRLEILAELAEALPDPCVLIDRRSIVMHLNRAAEHELPGVAAGNLLTLALRNPALLTAIGAARAKVASRRRSNCTRRCPMKPGIACMWRRCPAPRGSWRSPCRF